MTIEVRQLRSKVPLLDIEAITIEPGQIYIVLGQNGAGKTTLLKALVGLLGNTQSSDHRIDGLSWDDLSLSERSNLIGYCPQSLMPHQDLNTERFLASAGYSSGKSPAACLSAASKILSDNQLSHLAPRSLSTLSGGEWQRVILLSLELKNASYWFLDEPTNHLDPLSQIETLDYLGQQAIDHQRAIVLASHDLSLLGLLHRPKDLPPPTILMLEAGRLVGACDLNSDNTSEKLSNLFGVSVCTAIDAEGRTFLYPGRVASRG